MPKGWIELIALAVVVIVVVFLARRARIGASGSKPEGPGRGARTYKDDSYWS